METINDRSRSFSVEIAAVTGGERVSSETRYRRSTRTPQTACVQQSNKHCPELVEEFLTREGEERRAAKLLQPYDSADKVTLGLMAVYGKDKGMDTTLVDLLVEYSSCGRRSARPTAIR